MHPHIRQLLFPILLAMLATPHAMANNMPDDFPLYFSAPLRQSSDISLFRKWAGVLDRHPADMQQAENACRTNPDCIPNLWDNLIKRLDNLPRHEQITLTNKAMNRFPYIADIINWGMEDYWETPLEFYQKSGDCEDYAIAKYMTLRRLGFLPRDMRILVLNDDNLGIPHAVLVVAHEGKALILDNYITDVTAPERISHYTPIYAINEHQWWRH